MHHWEEEVKLLIEEQQHTLQFLEWHASWWMERASAIMTSDEALSEGHRVYAERQANLCLQIQGSFAHMWRDMQKFIDLADAQCVSTLT